MRPTRPERYGVAFVLTLVAILAVFIALGCGGTRIVTRTVRAPTLTTGPASCVPREGAGTMGACAPKPKSGAQLSPLGLSRIVPDVSYFQGRIDWPIAKPHIAGAIVRVADGNFNDPAFARNWHELKRLRIWHAAYFFLRPGNCAGEADRALAIIGGLDSGPLIADAEVPLNYGCAAAFVEEVHRRTGAAEVIYTAPGTWPGGPHGNALLWVASYGPAPGCVWTCSHVAWQFTDGQVGPTPHCTPGIGCDDISTDNGITRLGPRPQPTPDERRAAKRRSLAAHRALVRTLHRLIDVHTCRPGQHARPRSYHTVCGYWLREGQAAHRVARRLELELT